MPMLFDPPQLQEEHSQKAMEIFPVQACWCRLPEPKQLSEYGHCARLLLKVCMNMIDTVQKHIVNQHKTA